MKKGRLRDAACPFSTVTRAVSLKRDIVVRDFARPAAAVIVERIGAVVSTAAAAATVAAAATATATTAQQLDSVGQDFGQIALLAVLVVPARVSMRPST